MRLLPSAIVWFLVVPGCGSGSSARDGGAAADSAFAEVQARGQAVMGVDQYTSAHVFQDLPSGGRIILERQDGTDQADIARIREHMRDVAADFEAGNFNKPFEVHARLVPGTDVMAARRAAITYSVADRPRGAEVVISSSDPQAIAAVHAFLAFQRADHRSAGHEEHGPR